MLFASRFQCVCDLQSSSLHFISLLFFWFVLFCSNTSYDSIKHFVVYLWVLLRVSFELCMGVGGGIRGWNCLNVRQFYFICGCLSVCLSLCDTCVLRNNVCLCFGTKDWISWMSNHVDGSFLFLLNIHLILACTCVLFVYFVVRLNLSEKKKVFCLYSNK